MNIYAGLIRRIRCSPISFFVNSTDFLLIDWKKRFARTLCIEDK